MSFLEAMRLLAGVRLGDASVETVEHCLSGLAGLGVDNARDYQQWTGGLYLRYLFDDGRGAMPLPVNPYRSPDSN